MIQPPHSFLNDEVAFLIPFRRWLTALDGSLRRAAQDFEDSRETNFICPGLGAEDE